VRFAFVTAVSDAVLRQGGEECGQLKHCAELLSLASPGMDSIKQNLLQAEF
jgi:hypothetical protein